MKRTLPIAGMSQLTSLKTRTVGRYCRAGLQRSAGGGRTVSWSRRACSYNGAAFANEPHAPRWAGEQEPSMSAQVETEGKPGAWQNEVYDLLRRNRVTQFAYVPDAGHKILIDRSLADPDVHSVALTTEEEGVALLAGADLGGARGVLLMQSSGVGNCVN